MSNKVSLPRSGWLAAVLLLVAVFAFNTGSAWLKAASVIARVQQERPDADRPLAHLLKPDGTPDTRSYRTRTMPGGAAHLVLAKSAPGDENWDAQFTIAGVNGASSNVLAIVASGNEIYVGGSFITAGGVSANNVAKWNGSAWSALGGGVNGAVYAIAVSGNDVYVGGEFTTAGGVSASGIAKWNGSAWSALGSGITYLDGGVTKPGVVSSLAINGSDLYVGGGFMNAGGLRANNIAKWNGSTWSALGGGVTNTVAALLISGNDLYVGGYFVTASNNPANISGDINARHIAKWNGTAWAALGEGVAGGFSYVLAIARSGNDLYVGGSFTTAGGSSASNIAKWNGTAWSALGNGSSSSVSAIAVSGGDIYTSGFTTADGINTYRIAKWNGGIWSALGSLQFLSLRTLAVTGGEIYAGGFVFAGGFNGIAKWNGNAWLALGSGNGLNNPARALAVNGNDVYVGGSFLGAGEILASRIVRWTGTDWAAFGFLGGTVNAIAASGSEMYAGGNFTGTPNRIARWSVGAWVALGSGVGGSATSDIVNALAVSGSDLYAGGSFNTAGGASASNIARWDGSGWSALGSGVNGAVNAIAVSGSNVYAGGAFTTAGGMSASRIARWNGTSWAALGSGLDGEVRAILVSGSEIYVGGSFTTAGGVSASRIAKWNGTSWATLGNGVSGTINALAVGGNDLYAGGDFTLAGGISANRIARWNGSVWSALGSGTDGSVFALGVSGGDLYAGGNFTTAGAKPAAFFSRYRFCTAPSLTAQPANQTVCASAAASFLVTAAGTNLSYQWRKNGVNLADGGGISGATTAALTINPASAANAGAYDVVVAGACGTATSAPATLTVNTAPNVTAQPAANSALVGASVSFTAAASGNPTPSAQWQVSTDSGVTFNNLSGAVNPLLTLNAVTLAQNGYRYRAVFSNACGGVASVAATLIVNCPTIALSPASLSSGTTGTVYNQTVSASPVGMYNFAVTTGALPAGLSLNSATGAITGTPTLPGTFNFTITATGLGTCTGNQAYSITINCPTIATGPATIAAGAIGAAYNQSFTQTGGVGIISFSLTGTLPAGLSFNATTATLAGTPTQSGSFSVTVRATDANGCFGERNYTLAVNALAPALTSLNPNLAIAGGAGFTLTVHGTGFSNNSVVRWNGNDRTTSFVSDTQLRATIPAGDIATVGAANIAVFTPAPGGGTTSALSFTIASPVASVSTASFLGQELAQESIIAAFGSNLATEVKVADTLPLPTTLAGTSLQVKDSLGTERLAPLFFVAPSQINYLVPIGTALGAATVTVLSGAGSVSSGVVQITAVSPGLFSANANGQGVAAGAALRLKLDGTQIYEPLATYDNAQQRFVAAPLELGSANDQVFLILFGTGFRNLSNLSGATVRIGGLDAEVSYAGTQGGFAGLDQLNVRLPQSLSGRGEVEVALTVSGKAANIVKVSIR